MKNEKKQNFFQKIGQFFNDAFSDMVLKYIFCGGVYGSAENHIAVDKFRHQNCVAYALKRLFLPYKSMVISYPFLKKYALRP